MFTVGSLDELESLGSVELAMLLAVLEARESFWAFRRYMSPALVVSSWQRHASGELQDFYEALVAGKRPKLVIEAPPQHGKSRMVVEFVAWLCGKNPDLKVIYTSFSERLGERANLQLQRMLASSRFKEVFPDCRIAESGSKSPFATRNRGLVEFVGHYGYFRNTTVRGAITGESLDLGIVDDPIKSREEAGSKAVRDKTWDWFTDDFFTRFSRDAGFLSILTRWHIDDPIGRLKKANPNVRCLTYRALAESDDILGRPIGDPLFPEMKPLDFLLERKQAMAAVNWQALYQQNPQVEGGEVIHTRDFAYYDILPAMRYRAIFADTAQKTKEYNDYSVFECWGQGVDGRVYLIDLIRGKWEAPELERQAVAFWQKHFTASSGGALRFMAVEDKVSGTGLIQSLRRSSAIPLRPIQRSVDKYTRLMDVLGYIESGFVSLPKSATWLSDFLTECESFTPDGRQAHDDQIDPMVDALTHFFTGSLKTWENVI